jgi:hypothetical protein
MPSTTVDRVSRHLKRWVALVAACVPAWVLAPGAQAQGVTMAAARGALRSPIGDTAQPHAPWRLSLLPRQSKPITDFSVVAIDDTRVLRVSADKSYGTLLHPVDGPSAQARSLTWQWRVDQAPVADLRQRSGDDAALRVCVLFDWPQERLSFRERARLTTAELLAGEPLPTAALCYAWDTALPTGTVMPNAYTRRVRTIVVDGDGSSPSQWVTHRRELLRDFRAAFLDEWREGDTMPPITAVLIGSDTDNTGTMALAYLRDIQLEP